jgi:hypothetical protein
MLGPIGSQIMAIFRLLSPDEIDKYIVDERADEFKTEGTMSIAAGAEGMNLSSGGPHSQAPNKFPKDHQAKIIPLNNQSPEEKELLQDTPDDSQEQSHADQKPAVTEESKHAPFNNSAGDGNFGLEAIGVLSANQIKNIENKRRAEENGKRDSATVFLLKERERMRSAKRKMVEQVAIKSYQVNASQEFYEQTDEDLDEEENLTDSLKGILLNKKHF